MSLPLDYYSLLDLRRDASDTQIKLAYRKKALQFHPLKQHSPSLSSIASSNFRVISEAFSVLSSPALRAQFDQFGEDGLKNGKGTGRKWNFNQDPLALFQQQFGATSPFADYFQQQAASSLLPSPSASSTSALFPARTEASQSSLEKSTKVDDTLVNLYLSLEELYSGCSKHHKLTRSRLLVDESGKKKLELQDKIFKVDVGAGWKEGTKIKFVGEGNDELSEISNGSANESQRSSGDVIFLVRIKPHPRFVREGDDVIHTVSLSLLEALNGSKALELVMLDGRTKPLAITEIVGPQSEVRVKGEGFVKVGGKKKKKEGTGGGGTERGDLVLKFEVEFPKELTLDQKEGLARILG